MSAYMDSGLLQSSPDPGTCEPIQPKSDYVPPPFAQPIYPLLSDVRDMFSNLPSIGRGLAHAQKVFDDVNAGKPVDTKILHDVFTFRIAVEVLRMVLNIASRVPIKKSRGCTTHNADYSELSDDEKSYAVLAQALRYQSSKYQSIVAVVDATCLEGLLKFWNVSVPKELVGELVVSYEDYSDASNQSDEKLLLTSNPVLAVGVGATAVVGASSLSKVVPASTFMFLLQLSSTCAGLVMYGEQVECAAEFLPAATSIANLGRGIQNLHQAAEQTERSILQKSLEAMMYRLKEAKFQQV